MLFKLFLVTFLASAAFALHITYTDCGKGEVNFIDISPCDAEPCYIKIGESTNVTFNFNANQDTSTTKMKADIVIAGITTPLPFNPDGCKYLPCPLKKGQTYAYTYTGTASPFGPRATGTAHVNLTGASGEMICVIFKTGIQLDLFDMLRLN
eukprot:TRINITY_DN72905_c0_g1_i1.p1 TRINITY_DN72905_c0_g1~~TRINITY_DN72905_c0_g1_i1.p1  ORF type:complete len:152 (+),score=19.15 TRINITY_DN72905_c0_g1_i1:3-458(+)